MAGSVRLPEGHEAEWPTGQTTEQCTPCGQTNVKIENGIYQFT